MKINELLKEVGINPYDIKQLRTDNFSAFLQEHCSEFLDNNLTTPLYRGSRKGYGIGVKIIDVSVGTRKSENTTNHYTILMDNSKYYKDWPKRSKSLICSTLKSKAGMYGQVFCIIPFNGTKIAITEDEDIWLTRVDLYDLNWKGNLYNLNNILQMLEIPDTSIQNMINYTKTPKFKADFYQMFNEPKIAPEDFIPYLQFCMNPYLLKFSLEDTSSFSAIEYPNREVWFSGKCLVVAEKYYEDLIINRFKK
jgi:uncharacterized protein YlzI (FlbEa/FlbD family)